MNNVNNGLRPITNRNNKALTRGSLPQIIANVHKLVVKTYEFR